VATLDSPFAAGPGNNACYMVSKGSFGYAAINPLSGIIAGVPFGHYLDGDTGEIVLEVIMPTGGNAFSVTAINVRGYKKGNGKAVIASKGNISVSPSYRFAAPSYIVVFRLRLQNLYRGGGSDGWSTYTYYAETYQSTSTPNYDPSATPAVEVDFQAPTSYPSSRYATF
jgi:hypothetical protein